MRRSTLLLCAGIIMTAGFACTQQPASQAAGASTTSVSGGRACNAEVIISKTYVIPAGSGFQPWVNLQGGYRSPISISTPLQNNPTYEAGLRAALQIAPPFLMTHLCGLSALFINADTCTTPGDYCRGNSWGYRERPDQVTSGQVGRYVAVAAGLWNGSPKFLQYETVVLNDLLVARPSAQFTTVVPSTADSFAMTILAALAHEMGHVRWYDVLVPTYNAYDFNRLKQKCPDGAHFFDKSWSYHNNDTTYLQAPQWRTYGALMNINNVEHASSPTLADWYNSAGNQGNSGNAMKALHEANQPWATLLASLSPDEDFIETYTLAVLTSRDGGQPLTSLELTVQLGNGTDVKEDIVKDLQGSRKPELSRKRTCVLNSNDLVP
jgi:hypothetical protein